MMLLVAADGLTLSILHSHRLVVSTCVPVLQYYSTTVPQYYSTSTTVPQYYGTTVPQYQYHSSRAGLYYEEAFKAITMLGQNKYKKRTFSTKLVFYKTTQTQSGM